ncbi:MAG: sugar phosphate isomerase/epimerase family protein [Candidatus Latescibacterota bacterium]
MHRKITRRTVLAAGAGITGVLLGTAGASAATYRSKSPDPNVKRNLKPGNTPVRLALSTLRITYPKDGNMEGLVKRIRDAGYTSATTVSTLDRRNPLLAASDSEIAALKAALKKYDVVVFDVMTWCNPLHPDKDTRAKYKKYLIESLETGERIGAPMITTITGSCHPEFYNGIHPGNWTKEHWDDTVRYYKELLRDTSGMKIALGMEATVQTSMDGPEAHIRFKNDLNGDPRVKVCLDPANMTALDNYYHTTELLAECFERLGEDILGCHAKDPLILPDKMLCYVTEVAPGKGILDYESYLAHLSRMKWPRSLFIEHLPEAEYPGAKAFIEKTAARVGVKIYG